MKEKEELLKALEDSYKAHEDMYDNNLEKMADYQRRIHTLKDRNRVILDKMTEVSNKIRGLKQ